VDVVERADLGVGAAVSAWLPGAFIVPLIDAVALTVALAIADSLDPFGVAFAAITWLALNWGTWRVPRINPRIGADVGWIIARVAIITLAFLPIMDDRLGEARVLTTGAIAALVLVPSRALAYAGLRAMRRRGRGAEATLIVGTGPIADLVGRACREHPEFGLHPVGVIDASDPDEAREGRVDLPLLGSPADLPRVIRERDVRRVIVAFGAAREDELIAILRAASELPVAVYCVPRFFELRVPRERARSDDIWGVPLIRLSGAGPRTLERLLKRAVDLVVSAVALLLAAPVLAVAACAIRLSSPGPILFRQERVGEGGRIFGLLKFRSMLVNDDSDVAWSVVHDDRVTRVGRFLRKTSLDELPQLLNILKGEMSLVGPRPERPHFVQQFSASVPHYSDRLRAPAGLTGWAQVHGLRGDTSIAERVRFDNAYIENWSLWLDLVIIARTLREALMGGERRAHRHEVRRMLEAPLEAESAEARGEEADVGAHQFDASGTRAGAR
jgi:exopolysaccharide biosynthesis polyprenyl glycosylphosphotransferase